MKLITLGTGTSVPSLKRAPPSYLLKIKDKLLLIDCGAETLLQLIKAKESYKNIDVIFLTHFHTDHACGLFPLIQALNWTPGFDRKKDLQLVGPVGLKKFHEDIVEKFSGKPRPNTYKIIVKEMKEEMKDGLDFKDFKVECTNTVHSEPSIAYRFYEGHKSIVLSGDADYDEGIIKLSENVNLLVLECSFANNEKVKGHLIPEECGLIAKKSKAKKLLLTHIYPTASAQIRLREAKKIFKNTKLAKDLMRINI